MTNAPFYANYAWDVDFTDGNIIIESTPNNYYVRPVRCGQTCIPGNLYITSPRQASSWNIGSTMPITWDTADISGNVAIYLSRYGGKNDGSFETLSAGTENDGYFEWEITGPATVNAFLRIEPLFQPNKGTSASLFSIGDYISISPDPSGQTISEQDGSNTLDFTFRLTQAPASDVIFRLSSSNESDCFVSPSLLILKDLNWSSGVPVTLTALDNDIADGTRECVISAAPLESYDRMYSGMTVPDISITIEDDEENNLTIRDVVPNAGTAGTAIRVEISGTRFTQGNTQAYLIRRDENGSILETIPADQIYWQSENKIKADFPGPSLPGHYSLQIYNGIDTAEAENALTFGYAELLDHLDRKKAVIAAGGTGSGNALWKATANCANRAFRALFMQGYTKDADEDGNTDNIYYLSNDPHTDVNGDGITDADAQTTLSALSYAVNTWARNPSDPTDELILYMTDHGGDGVFRLNETEWLSAETLKTWLDSLQTAQQTDVIVIYDACMAGSFVSRLKPSSAVPSDRKRIIITGASADEPAWFLDEGEHSFSWYFWHSVSLSGKLYFSWLQAKNMLLNIQTPLTDYNRNGIPDTVSQQDLDSGLIPEVIISRGRIAASEPPEIGNIYTDKSDLGCETAATVYAENISAPRGLSRVWIRIYPPAEEYRSSDEPLTELPSLGLNDLPPKDSVYEGTYQDFKGSGSYRIIAYARDREDTVSLPKEIRIVRTCGIPLVTADINMDAKTGLEDALTVLKLLAGTDVSKEIRADYAVSGADVNGDGKPGLAEAVYILQTVAGLRR